VFNIERKLAASFFRVEEDVSRFCMQAARKVSEIHGTRRTSRTSPW
jgi:hypothetical protein